MLKYIILFVVINTGIASYLYHKSSNIVFTAFITAPVAAALLHLIDYMILGYIDPFIIFGFFITVFYCMLFSLAILFSYKFVKDILIKRKVKP